MRNVTGTILILITLSMFLIPSQGENLMNKYRWYPTESAPKLYPMEIIKGDLIFSDGTSIYIPDHKIVNNGWGETNSTYISGDEEKPIPVKLEVSWFSYAEDKFFSGAYILPYEKILLLFDEGFISPVNGNKTTYNRIIVGLAPEGEISVWLTGEGVTTEVANFKAKETSLEWSTIIDNADISRKEYIDIVLEENVERSQLEEVKTKGSPAGLWETYRQQTPWQIEVVGSEPFAMWVKTFNGEQEFFNFSNSDNSRAHRSIPKNIKLNWEQTNQKKYTANIIFDEKEIIQAHKKLIAGRPDHELTFQLEISEQSHTVDVFIKDDKFILKLENSEIKRYKME